MISTYLQLPPWIQCSTVKPLIVDLSEIGTYYTRPTAEFIMSSVRPLFRGFTVYYDNTL